MPALCNEQRGNRPKPCYSLHASPLQWRKFPLQMAPASHPDSADFAPRWRRFRSQRSRRIVPLHVLAHYCGLQRSSDRAITHFRPQTRNATFHTPTRASVCTVGMRPRADFVYIHRRRMAPGQIWQVYVHLECRQRPISCTYTGGGREMPDQVGHDVDKTKRSGIG